MVAFTVARFVTTTVFTSHLRLLVARGRSFWILYKIWFYKINHTKCYILSVVFIKWNSYKNKARNAIDNRSSRKSVVLMSQHSQDLILTASSSQTRTSCNVATPETEIKLLKDQQPQSFHLSLRDPNKSG